MSMELDKTTEAKVYGRVKARDMRKGMIVMLGAFTPFRIIDATNVNAGKFIGANTKVEMVAPDGTTVFAHFDSDWEYDMLGDFG